MRFVGFLKRWMFLPIGAAVFAGLIYGADSYNRSNVDRILTDYVVWSASNTWSTQLKKLGYRVIASEATRFHGKVPGAPSTDTGTPLELVSGAIVNLKGKTRHVLHTGDGAAKRPDSVTHFDQKSFITENYPTDPVARVISGPDKAQWAVVFAPVLKGSVIVGYLRIDADLTGYRALAANTFESSAQITNIGAALAAALLLILVVRQLMSAWRQESRFRHLAGHDAVTGLLNRRGLLDLVDEMAAAAGDGSSKRQQGFAVCLLDIDNFKLVNDTLGHSIGDGLLVEFSKRLGSVKAGPRQILGMLSDGEFAVLLPRSTDHEVVENFARRMSAALTMPYSVSGREVTATVNIGIALAPADGHDAQGLFKNARLALFRAKSEGKGNYRFFEPEMDAAVRRRQRVEAELRTGIDREEFRVFYQPQVDLNTTQVVGYEALVRWEHSEDGLMGPGEFFDIAEASGLVGEIGNYVIREACKQAASWSRPASISVNLSPGQFQSEDLIEEIKAALDESGLEPHRLELEVTESVLIDGIEHVTDTLLDLKTLGVGVVLDNFGAGYSSLSHVTKFPYDKIKIDKSFVRNIDNDSQAAAVVGTVVALGRALNIAITAEGVETIGQATLLQAAGCPFAQGYLYGRPSPWVDKFNVSTSDRGAEPVPVAATA